MIVRPHYLDLLKTYRDVPLVKILAGIRRCGKSTILDMLQDDLIKSGVPADHIISMRYTSEDFDDGMTDKDMYNGIKENLYFNFFFGSELYFAYVKSGTGKSRIAYAEIFKLQCSDLFQIRNTVQREPF